MNCNNVMCGAHHTTRAIRTQEKFNVKTNIETTNDATTETIVNASAKKTRRDIEMQMRAELNDERCAEYASIIGLHKQGMTRSEIARILDTTYSRLTFVIWHHTYDVNAIPGMFAYTKQSKGAAQKRYESDVAQRKSAKS